MAIEHSAIDDPYRHEPKGASTATSGSVYVSNGSGSGSWAWPQAAITLDIADVVTTADYYIVFPHNATINKIYSVIDGAIATANKVLTASIGGTPVTDGAITIDFSGSAAGTIDNCTPSAANTITAGAALKIAATGGSTGSARAHITVVYTRTA